MSVSAAESSAVAHSRQRRNDGEWQAAASPLHRSSSHSPPSGARNSRLAVSDLLTAPSAVSAEGSSGAGKGSEQNVRRDQALVGSSDEFQAGNRGPSSTESARRQSKQHSPKRSPSLQTIAEDRSASRPMKSTNSTVAAIGKAEHARDANSSGGGSGGTGVRYSSNSSVTPVDANAGGLGDGVAAYQYAAAHQITEERENIEYILSIREQPKHSRMCGVGEKGACRCQQRLRLRLQTNWLIYPPPFPFYIYSGSPTDRPGSYHPIACDHARSSCASQSEDAAKIL